MGLREMTLILLPLLLFVTGCLAQDLPERKEWNASRAVKLAEKLVAKEIFWMFPVANETSLLEPAKVSGRQVTDVESSNSTDKSGNAPYNGTTSNDRCQDATIVVHKYKEGGKDIPLVISDLTNALVLVSDKCECAEEGATVTEVDGTNLCIKGKGAVPKGEECIHNAECAGEFVCIFDATINGNEGDVEDMRRFCSGSGTLAPALLILLVSLVASKLHA